MENSFSALYSMMPLQLSPTDPRLQPFLKNAKERERARLVLAFTSDGEPEGRAKEMAERIVKQLSYQNSNFYLEALEAYQQSLSATYGGATEAAGSGTLGGSSEAVTGSNEPSSPSPGTPSVAEPSSCLRPGALSSSSVLPSPADSAQSAASFSCGGLAPTIANAAPLSSKLHSALLETHNVSNQPNVVWGTSVNANQSQDVARASQINDVLSIARQNLGETRASRFDVTVKDLAMQRARSFASQVEQGRVNQFQNKIDTPMVGLAPAPAAAGHDAGTAAGMGRVAFRMNAPGPFNLAATNLNKLGGEGIFETVSSPALKPIASAAASSLLHVTNNFPNTSCLSPPYTNDMMCSSLFQGVHGFNSQLQSAHHWPNFDSAGRGRMMLSSAQMSQQAVSPIQSWVYRTMYAHQAEFSSNSPRAQAFRFKLTAFVQERLSLLRMQSVDWNSYPVPTKSEIENYGGRPGPPTSEPPAAPPLPQSASGAEKPQVRVNRFEPRRTKRYWTTEEDDSQQDWSPSVKKGKKKGGRLRLLYSSSSSASSDEDSQVNINTFPSAESITADAPLDFIPFKAANKRTGGKGRKARGALHGRSRRGKLGCQSDEAFSTLSLMSEMEFEERRRQQRLQRFNHEEGGSVDVVDVDGVAEIVRPLTWVEKLEKISCIEKIVGKSNALEKKYHRLCGPPDPAVVRPLSVLEKSFEFVLNKFRSDGGDWSYLEEQLRSIRQDLTVQQIRVPFCVEVYETNARLALANGQLGQFNQCQAQLPHLYRVLGYTVKTSNRAEFLGYRLLYLGLQNMRLDTLRIIGEMSDAEREHKMVEFALAVRKAVGESNYYRYFALYAAATEYVAKLMDIFAPKMRALYLIVLAKAHYHLAVPFLVRVLRFASTAECVQFLNSQGAVWEDAGAHPGSRRVDGRKSLVNFENSSLLKRKVQALG